MAFLKLTLYGQSNGVVLDPEQTIQKVKAVFPEAIFSPGDQTARAAERAEAQGAADHVVQTLQRNARQDGPSYAFEVPLPGVKGLHGRARRHDLTFLFDEPLPEAVRLRLIEFLRSFGVGRLEASTGTRHVQVLFDQDREMNGTIVGDQADSAARVC